MDMPEIDRVVIDADVLQQFTREDDFTGVAVELLKEAASYVCLAASILPGDTRSWTRDQAIVGGQLVRLFKMMSAMLDQTCQHRGETVIIFSRLAFECMVNVLYFVQEDSPDIFDSYIRYSFSFERQLKAEIEENTTQRDGEILPIEQRMLRSIDKYVAAAGVSLDDVHPTGGGPWKNKSLYKRSKAIGWREFYLGTFSGASAMVHGNWQDLFRHHLDQNNEGGFTPHLDWDYPRPQPLFATGILAIQVLNKYFDHWDEQDAMGMQDKMTDLLERMATANDAHEAFLCAKRGTEGPPASEDQ